MCSLHAQMETLTHQGLAASVSSMRAETTCVFSSAAIVVLAAVPGMW